MTAIKSRHSRAFEQLVAERRQALLEALAAGHPENAYWAFVGQVRGLDEALLLSEAADFKLNGEEQSASS